GEIMIGSAADLVANKAAKYGRGKLVTLTGSSRPEVAKINKNALDNFDTWSFNRANTLTAANVAALRLNRAYGTFSGGWIYDPFYNCYTFMPYRGRFYSPYGFGFFNNWNDCYGYDPYGYRGGGVVSNLPPRVVTGLDRAPIRRETEGRVLDSGSSVFDSSRGSDRSLDHGSSSTPSSSSSSSGSSSSTTVISSPAPSRDTGGGSRSGSVPTRP